jgi:hypothetical protein
MRDIFWRKRLYVGDLAARLQAMEEAAAPMNATAYRLFARRLRTALAGCAQTAAANSFGATRAVVGEMVQQRFFDEHGMLPGERGRLAKAAAEALLSRMTRNDC